MKNKKGFTLVELVIVIAVIAILAAVLLPTFAGILERARENTRVQKATSARDEFLGSSNISSIEEMKNYIIEVEGSVYKVAENGKLEKYDSLEECAGGVTYEPINNVELVDGVTILAPNYSIIADLPGGVYVNNELTISWQTLIDNGAIEVYEGTLVKVHNEKFDENSTLVIDDSITKIGCDAFRSTYNITQVKIPSTLKMIECYAFAEAGITSIEIPSTVETIEYCAFNWCYYLETVKLPDNLTSIPYSMFYCCNSLKTIEIPQSVTRIEEQAFSNCSSLNNVYISSSISYIGNGAFSDCSSLTNLQVDEENTNFYSDQGKVIYTSNSILYVMSSLSGEYEILSEVTLNGETSNIITIPSSIFKNCDLLTKITIPSTIENIYGEAFYGCDLLEEVVLNEGVKNIYGYVFACCTKLTSINLPASLESIQGSTFRDSGLTSLTLDENNKNYMFDGKVLYSKDTVVLALTSIEGEYTILENVTINNETTQITKVGAEAFYNCTGLTSINFASSINIIEGAAFSFTGLTSVEVPYGVEVIANSTFANCFYLVDVVLPNSIKTLEANSFNGCWELTEIVLPQGLEEIGGSSFSGTAITDIVFPSSIKKLNGPLFIMGTLQTITFEHTNDDELYMDPETFLNFNDTIDVIIYATCDYILNYDWLSIRINPIFNP